jgi:hypothetical protein
MLDPELHQYGFAGKQRVPQLPLRVIRAFALHLLTIYLQQKRGM